MDQLVTLGQDPAAWVALATLLALEVVLGIDNLIFISILTNKLPVHQCARAQKIGIAGALVLRLALLGTISFIVALTEPVFSAVGRYFSWKDIILIIGVLFLVWLIGTTLIAEGFGAELPKGYVYGAIAFSALIETLNILARRARQPADVSPTVAPTVV